MTDSIKAAKFLRLFRKDGYINIVAIHPETGKIKGITRFITSTDIDNFIKDNNGKCNLYFMVNEPYDDAPDDKLKKEHVKSIHALFIDADPDKEKDFKTERIRIKSLMDNLNNANTPPSYVIDSGGGYQAFWLLSEPLSSGYFPLVEQHGRGLAHLHNTDAVQNIDRIMRIPYTLNIPNAKKLAAGRKPAFSTVTHASQQNYEWDVLSTLAAPKDAPTYDDNSEYDIDMTILKNDMDIDLKMRWFQLLETDSKLNALTTKTIKKPSRSEYDFAIMKQLKSAGWNIQDAAQALWLCDAGKGKELTKREITRAYGRAENTAEFMGLPAAEIERINNQVNPTALQPYVKSGRKYKTAGQLSWRSGGLPLYKGLIKQSTLVAVYGQSNVGKSFVIADLAGHLAAGKDWAGHKLKGGKSGVLVVAAEAGETYGERADALKMRMGMPMDVGIDKFPFCVLDEHINIVEKDEKTGVFPGVEEIITQWGYIAEDSGVGCKMIVIDTLSAVFGGKNENSSDDMGLLIENLMIIKKRTGATVVIVHHSGKDQAAGLRGHTKLIGALDSSFEVRESIVGGKIRKEIISKKQRSGKKDGIIEFNLNEVEVGIDEDGDSVTSCNIILPTDLEFEAIIPDILGQLTDVQRIMYKTVQVCQSLPKCDRITFFGWYNFVSNHADLSIETLRGLTRGQAWNGELPIPASEPIKKSSFHKGLSTLRKEGYIEKSEQNQWVIVNEE